MSNKIITMQKIKQIIKSSCSGWGSKKISSTSGVSRNTVKKYIHKFKELKISWEELSELTDNEVHELFIVNPAPLELSERYTTLQALLPSISKALMKKGSNMSLLWSEYIKKHPSGYQLSQYRAYLRQYLSRSSITMHFEHKAGDKMFVDYCGDKLYIVDTDTGELKPVEVFVAILGCSQYTYVEASMTQSKEDFICCCRSAFEYYGGATQAIVPDNLKSAVTRSSKYEPVINEAFETFAQHYNTTVLPARAYRPRDKSLVEGAVKLVYQRIYTKLRTLTFTSLADLNMAIRHELVIYNNRSLKQEESRYTRFITDEKKCLTALPDMPWEVKSIHLCTVLKNAHVCLSADRHYYSVPYKFQGKKVKILYSNTMVDIFYQYKKIASHIRCKRSSQYTTNAEHMPSHHKFVTDWSAEYFIAQGNKISPVVGEYLQGVLDSRSHPEQGYKSCAGILHLGRKAGDDRLILACQRAILYEAYGYPVIEEILRKKLETVNPFNEEVDIRTKPPQHINIRGKEYYN